MRTGISRALHSQHNDGHKGKETGETKTEAIDGHVAQGVLTIQFQRAARERVYGLGAIRRGGVRTKG